MVTADAQFETVRLSTHASAEEISALRLGTVVYLDGVVYTAREGVYKRVLEEGASLPLDLASTSKVNFHCSPAAAARPNGGFEVGAVTATASFRFSHWMAEWFRRSQAQIIIGKGGMAVEDYRQHFVPNGAIYLTTVGYGTGALLGRGVRAVKAVHWLHELGLAQALWVFEVANFGPFLVECDRHGESLFERNNAEVNAGIAALYEGLKPPALRRFGETDDRSDELI